MDLIDLRGITLVCQDWGSFLGLRLAAENPDRFDRIVVANGALPIADRPLAHHLRLAQVVATHWPWPPIGRLVSLGCLRSLSRAEIAAYDAPFPSARHKAGPRAFPGLLPTRVGDPEVAANRAAWAELGRWEKPFLTVFGERDPLLGDQDDALQRQVPGARSQPHARLPAGHFIQEDCGPELAHLVVDWMRGPEQTDG